MKVRGDGDGSESEQTAALLPSQKDEAEAEAQRSGSASERPGIWQLAFPSILGNLPYTVVGIVQTKFIG
ncbi:MAG: hypothetical protein EP301_02865, partial [Gammaproteobacteria bacterium]